MKNSGLVSLVVLVVLTACHNTPRRFYSTEEKDTAMIALKECYKAKTRKVDDGVSDAFTIASVVSNLCYNEAEVVSEIYSSDLNPNAKAKFLVMSREKYAKNALITILQERNKSVK